MLNTRESGSDMELLDIKRALAALDVELKLCRLIYLLRKYSPGQPRVPAGSPQGGQWTRGGGGGGASDRVSDASGEEPSSSDGGGLDADARVQLAQGDTSYDVDLSEQERLGGHAISRHVAMSENTLVARVLESGQRITARGDWFTEVIGSQVSLKARSRLWIPPRNL